MLELLAELQDAGGSQLVVTQVQAGETGPLQQLRGQGWAAGTRQPAAPQAVGARGSGKEGFGLGLLSCCRWEGESSAWEGGSTGPCRSPFTAVSVEGGHSAGGPDTAAPRWHRAAPG